MNKDDSLYDYLAHQDCLPQPETEADKAEREADERIRRGQELTRILMENLGGSPFKP